MSFRFKPEDFILTQSDAAQSFTLPEIYSRKANTLLEAQEKKCGRVFSRLKNKTELEAWRESRFIDGPTDHTALLWNLENIPTKEHPRYNCVKCGSKLLIGTDPYFSCSECGNEWEQS